MTVIELKRMRQFSNFNRKPVKTQSFRPFANIALARIAPKSIR
jgi:hypothetical protein